MTRERKTPPHLPGGLITVGSWRGHYLGCMTAGCAATRCTPAFSNAWLDETAPLRTARGEK